MLAVPPSTAALACVASHPRIGHPDPAIYSLMNPTVWKFTEYDHFADRALCDDVLRRG
jgi:hypothetical protein